MTTDIRRVLIGTPVVPGRVVAPVFLVQNAVEEVARGPWRVPTDSDSATRAYDDAVFAVSEGLSSKAAALSGHAAEVLAATSALARDKGLRNATLAQLKDGAPLVAAVEAAVGQFAAIFRGMGGLMAEREVDLHDIERRIIAHLTGASEPGLALPETPSVLVAEDLAPADAVSLDPALVLALVTQGGGPTSHTAIVARQLDIPCVVGVREVLSLATGTDVLVDGAAGTVEVAPDRALAALRVDEWRDERERIQTWTPGPASEGGHRVKLMANVGDVETAQVAAACPVEGAGLFRTELSFCDAAVEPSLEEQAQTYAGVLDAFGPDRLVVIRTLDAGSDKPIAYAGLPDEANPALGVRGYRLKFVNPGLMERQLDAIAAAAQRTGTAPWVMAPMISTASEARDFAELARARALTPGVMVEVPSAALRARDILAEVDFVSIGTNDLTQYTMAADRTTSSLAHLNDAWHPAVLELVRLTAAAGTDLQKPVGVCGEAAADPVLAAVFMGLGVTSLSMASAAVNAVGARLASLTFEECRDAARAALAADDAAGARAAARASLSL